MALFADSACAYRPPAAEPTLRGKVELADFYAAKRFSCPGLRAELISRTVLGSKVFDHERVWGVADRPIEMIAVFEVRDGLIQRTWAFTPE